MAQHEPLRVADEWASRHDRLSVQFKVGHKFGPSTDLMRSLGYTSRFGFDWRLSSFALLFSLINPIPSQLMIR